jgi:hypothetical protein
MTSGGGPMPPTCRTRPMHSWSYRGKPQELLPTGGQTRIPRQRWLRLAGPWAHQLLDPCRCETPEAFFGASRAGGISKYGGRRCRTLCQQPIRSGSARSVAEGRWMPAPELRFHIAILSKRPKAVCDPAIGEFCSRRAFVTLRHEQSQNIAIHVSLAQPALPRVSGVPWASEVGIQCS